MKELIAISTSEIQGASIKTVNARDLHEFLENKYQFSNWIIDRIKQYDFSEGIDFITIKNNLYSPPRKEYHLAIDMAKELAMVERTAKGKEAPSSAVALPRHPTNSQTFAAPVTRCAISLSSCL